MRKIVPLLVAALAAAGLVTVTGISPVSAGAGGETTDVYAVHGLNLGGQTAQTDGGSNVTVCAGDANPALIADFAFGDIVGPVPVPTGSSLPLKVYLGADEDCETPSGAPVIDQTIASVPAGTVAAIATQRPDSQAPEILPVALDAECAVADSGRLTGVHAANAPSVDVLVNTAPAGSLVFGEDLAADLPAATYSVQVDLGGNPIVGPADIPVTVGNNTIVYVVGNLPGDGGSTPVVPLVQNLAIDTCEPAVSPTTVTPQTPAAAPVAAQPTFTG